MKEEVRFKISGTKRRCILIKRLIDAVVPIIGWQIGNRNPIVNNNDPELLEYLKPHIKAFENKDIKSMQVESLIGWWTEQVANDKYYS